MTPSATHLNSNSIRSGDGALTVEMVSGQCALTSAWAASPLKILSPRPRGQSVWAYLSSFGGGFVAGDEVRLQVKLGADTRCFLSTQASTKIYRNPQLRPCSFHLSASLEAGSILVQAPDPIQAFAGSSYRQRQEFHLESTAGLMLVDWFCSGRIARGERWAFGNLESRNEIFVGGQPLLIDALSLHPDEGTIDGRHRMGRFNCLALVVLAGKPLRDHARRIFERAACQNIQRSSTQVTSASPIRDGVVLRIAGEKTEDVAREIREHFDFLAEVLGDDPLARKW